MIYFLIYLFLEVMISGSAFERLGTMGTFAEIILSAVVGFVLIANFRVTVGESLMALQRGNISPEEFQKLNIFTIVGAILLILPGFFSDLIGLSLQFGFIATLLANRIGRKKNQHPRHGQQYSEKKENDEIIDVEVIDHTPRD